MTAALSELIDRHGVDVHDYLDREVGVPVHPGLQRQGDVLIIPTCITGDRKPAATRVPAEGVPVVRGEAGGNTHLLLAEGDVRCDTVQASPTSLALGTLTVPEDATAYLAHPEHGYTGIGPGTYMLRRQREQADELRLIAD